jgi:hypothetical protein
MSSQEKFIIAYLFVILILVGFVAGYQAGHPVNKKCDCGNICSTTSSHCELKECPKHKTAGEPLSNKQLQAWFDGLNEEYFMSRLPRAAVTWGDLTILKDMGVTMHPEGNFIIIIDRDTNRTKSTTEETISHETCHVATWDLEMDAHGPKFQACMVNLANKGAFEGIW